MSFIKALFLIAAAYVMSVTAGLAAELCPAGPFETDPRVIAAAIAAQPLKPHAWDASPDSRYTSPPLTDGFSHSSSGGLMSYVSESLSYDAKRYVAVSVITELPLPEYLVRRAGSPSPVDRLLSNQVVRHSGPVTYITTIARPTSDQVRQFACVVNRLTATSNKEDSPTPDAPDTHPMSPAENGAGPKGDRCNSTGAYSIHGSDDYEEGFALLSRGTPVKYDTALSCATRSAYTSRLDEIVGDMINESIAEAKGTWQTPYVRSIATDASDNLYLLLDPGTLKHKSVDIRKITPAGNITRLAAPIFQTIDHGTFTIGRTGNPVVGVDFELYDVEPDIAPDRVPWYGDHVNRVAFSHFMGGVQLHAPIDSIAGDASNHFYAISGPDIVQFTLAGDLVVLASIPQRDKSRSRLQPSYVTATPDGSLFVSNSSINAIFKVTPEKTVTLLAGTLGKFGTTDGPAAEARFNAPKGLAVDRSGAIYVADSGNQIIRRITPDGLVSTFAGKAGQRGSVDGQGTAARLDRPTSIAIDSSGTLYVVNGEDNRIRKISPEGVVSTMNAQQFIDAP
jgi:NHL repeat